MRLNLIASISALQHAACGGLSALRQVPDSETSARSPRLRGNRCWTLSNAEQNESKPLAYKVANKLTC
jgi:hypothetical protein